MTDADRCRLYLVSPPALDAAAFRDKLAAALDAGDVACLQLHLTDTSDDEARRAVDVLRPVAQDRGVAVLLRDRPELAAETGCDGVHLESDGGGCKAVRHILGPQAIVGAGCGGSRHRAMVAAEQGADYVAFGAFFAAADAPPDARAGPEILAWWSDLMEVPCVATGGITVDNAATLITAGADFLAVAEGVWDHEDGPAAAVRAFNEIMASAG